MGDLTIRTEVPRLAPTIGDRVRGADLPGLGHFLDSGFIFGVSRFAGTGLVFGRAITVRLDTTDSTLVHYITTLVEPGDFVVIDASRHPRHAPVGDVVALGLASAGAVGVVIDGACTDLDGLAASGLSVYARTLSPMTTRRGPGALDGAINVPVEICGTEVLPGMLVLGDANGLLITNAATVEHALDAIDPLVKLEPAVVRRIGEGERLGDITIPVDLMTRLRSAAGTQK